MISEVSKRYAKALFDYSRETKKTDKVASQLNQLAQAFETDHGVRDFVSSPIISHEEKLTAIKKALGNTATEEILNLTGLLIEKNRIEMLPQVSQAFALITDEANGVTRGDVKSATPLNEDSRRKIEQTVETIIKKKVILNYAEDKTIMGGLVADVGGWTFDDSLRSHLKRLSEDLNRRV